MLRLPAEGATVEARLDALIGADLPVTAEWITDAALDANPGPARTMAVQPPRGTGRVIRIGPPEGTVDLQPCGGAHVRRTAEIGRVTLGKIERKGAPEPAGVPASGRLTARAGAAR